jgi:hypothetical protein
MQSPYYRVIQPPTPLTNHECVEIMDEVFSSWPDLMEQPISHPDVEYFTDGSSFVQEGT